MSALVIDTSVWVTYFAGEGPESIDRALEEGRVWLPPIVAAELASGTPNARQRALLEDLLTDLPLCDCDLAHWFRVGELRSLLARRGVTVSTPDAHIAQCSIDLDAELLTADKIFRQVSRVTDLRLAITP